VICPKCGATRLIIHCTEQAAAALAEGADEWANAWADLAARIRGDDPSTTTTTTTRNGPDDHPSSPRPDVARPPSPPCGPESSVPLH
jgi:hypothetical protein